MFGFRKKAKRPEDAKVLAIAVSHAQRRQVSKWAMANNAWVVQYVDDTSSTDQAPCDRESIGSWLLDPPKPWDIMAIDAAIDVFSEVDHALDLVDWCRGHNKRCVFIRDGIDSRDEIPDESWRKAFPGQKSARFSDDVTK